MAKVDGVFSIARVDMKNRTSPENDIIVMPLNTKCKIHAPEWYSKDGRGYVLETSSQNIKL